MESRSLHRLATPTKYRVMIFDDHLFFAKCLRALIDAAPDFEVCDIRTSAQGLNDRIRHLQPDVLVIDLALGEENGLELGQQLRAQDIETPILFMSTMRCLDAGHLASVSRSAFVAKSRAPFEFLTQLRGVLTQSEPAAMAATEAVGFL